MREKSTYRGGYGEKDVSSVSERGTETQCLREKPIDRLRSDRVVTLLLSLLGWGGEVAGRERRIESVYGRHRGTTSECVCMCVCMREKQ